MVSVHISNPSPKQYALDGAGLGNSQMEVYDFQSGNWRTAAPMLTTCTNFGVAALGGKLYVVGGRTISKVGGQLCLDSVNTAECFSPSSNSWTQLPPMSIGREWCGVAALDSFLYVVGGYSYMAGSLNTVERYSLASNRWEPLPPMSTRREGCGVAVLGGSLCVYGGMNGKIVLNSAERFDQASNSWVALPPMPHKRAKMGVAVMDGLLYICGGWSGDCSRELDSAVRFDPASGCWSPLPPMSRKYHACNIAVLRGLLLVLGSNCTMQCRFSMTNMVECFSPISNTWSLLPPMAFRPHFSYANIVSV